MWIRNRETGETLNMSTSTYLEKQRFIQALPVDQRKELAEAVRETHRRLQEGFQNLARMMFPFVDAMLQGFQDAGQAVGRMYGSSSVSKKSQDQQRRDVVRADIMRVNAGNRRRQQRRRR